MIYIVSPEGMKACIDSRVLRGVKAFLVSDEKYGEAFSPSKRTPHYRIPSDASNLSRVLGGSRLILPIVDLSWLGDEARKVLEESIRREESIPEKDGGK